MEGTILYKNNINNCYKELNDVDLFISSNFEYKSRNLYDYDHPGDKTGNSTVKEIFYDFNLGIMQLNCIDWSEKKNYTDHLRVSIQTFELDEFIYNDFYN